MIDDPGEETWEEFDEAMGVSADCDGEGFFHYDLRKCWKYRGVNIEYTQSILDEGHEQLKTSLSQAEEIEEVRSTFASETRPIFSTDK